MYSRTTMKNIPNRGGIFRVRLKLHYTWLFALVIVTFNLTTQLAEAYSIWLQLGWGVATVVVFLLMLLVRQFAINLLAISRGIPLRRVTLYILGGVPGIPRIYTSPLVELLLGVSGFLFSLFVIMVYYIVYLFFVVNNLALASGLVFWLIVFMLLFTVLNIIPGFPLDGGRIMRALMWRANKDYDRSTRFSARIGQLSGIILMAFGIWIIFLGRPWFEDGTIILTGWIVLVAATHAIRVSNLCRYLIGTRISDVIIYRDLPQISSQLSIRQLVDDYVLASGHYFFIVTEEGKVRGFVTLSNVRKVPRRRWNSRTIGSIVKQVNGIYHAAIEQSAADVLEQMIEMDIRQMPVIQGDNVVGIVDRDELLRLSRLRKDLRFLSSRAGP